MGVDVPQDGHSLHGVSVPDTDVRVIPHLTRRHLDLIWMHGQTETDRRTEGQTNNIIITSARVLEDVMFSVAYVILSVSMIRYTAMRSV